MKIKVGLKVFHFKAPFSPLFSALFMPHFYTIFKPIVYFVNNALLVCDLPLALVGQAAGPTAINN